MFIFKIAPTEVIPTPVIKSEHEFHGKIGEQLVLNCTIEYNVGIDMDLQWSLPKHIRLPVSFFKFIRFLNYDPYVSIHSPRTSKEKFLLTNRPIA